MRCAIVAMAVGLVACNGATLVVAEQPDATAPVDAGPTFDATPADAAIACCTAPPGASGALLDGGQPPTYDASAAQTWSGYFQNFTFPTTTDTVTLTLSFDGTNAFGTAFFGAPPAIAPPTSPDQDYPPEDAGGWDPQPDETVERFPFTILRGSIVAGRLQFDLAKYEVWKAQCELQTQIYPVCNGDPSGTFLGFGCMPYAETTFGGGHCSWSAACEGTHTVSCTKLVLCSAGGIGVVAGPACTCGSTGCTVDLYGPDEQTLHFDVQLDGDAGTATGSVTGFEGATGPVTVNLTQQ